MAVSSVSIVVDPKTRQWLQKLERSLGRDKFNRTMLPFMDRQAKKAAGYISANMLSGQRLNRRTGTLARSVLGVGLIEKGNLPAMRVGVFRSAAPYAGIQERGGVIKPKKGKALAIPMDAAKTPAGVEKFGGPRGYPGKLSFVPFRGSGVAVGGLFLPDSLRSASTLAEATMMYLLVRQVTIKPKWYLRDGFAEYLPQVADDLAVFLKSIVTQKDEAR